MQTMLLLVGLPASGKSAYAQEFVEKRHLEGWFRINYDELRHEDPNWVFTRENEKKIQETADTLARLYVARGFNLLIDNTNLSSSAKMRWQHLADELGMEVEYKSFDTPLDECIRRDSLRTGWRKVGRAVIERMALWNGLVEFPPDRRQIVLVDMDGTLADLSHRKDYLNTICQTCCFGDPVQLLQGGLGGCMKDCLVCSGTGKVKKNYEGFYGNCFADPVIRPTQRWVQSLAGQYIVCIVSGRPIDKAGEQTVEWLAKNEIPYDRLFMRNSGDHRPDTMVKKEILDRLPKDRIAFAIDDRPCVIRMWQENGLRVYDVGNGVEF